MHVLFLLVLVVLSLLLLLLLLLSVVVPLLTLLLVDAEAAVSVPCVEEPSCSCAVPVMLDIDKKGVEPEAYNCGSKK